MTCQSMPTGAEEGGAGDVVVGDVVDLEAAGRGAAQQHVAGVAAEEPAETNELPIGSDQAQLIARQDRVVADVVDLVLTRDAGGRVRAAQDHVGGGAGGRRRIRRDCEEETMTLTLTAGGVDQASDDLVVVVDAIREGHAVGDRIVDGDENAAAVEEGMEVGEAPAGGDVYSDDLACIVDASGFGAATGGQRIVEGGVGAAIGVVEEAVSARTIIVEPNDLARIVDAGCYGAIKGRRGIVERGERVRAVVGIVDEAVSAADAASILVGPDDHAQVVDSECLGEASTRHVEGAVGAAASGVVDEAVNAVLTGVVSAHNLATGVDAPGLGAEGTGVVGQWVGERGVGAAAEEETVTCIGACVAPDDLAQIIDPGCLGPAGAGGGIVERGEIVDWHDAPS
jgi:hypothetical protein